MSVGEKSYFQANNGGLLRPGVMQLVSGIILGPNVAIPGRSIPSIKILKNAKTWPRFAKTWSPEWENGGALRHPTVGECSPEKYCCLQGFLQFLVRMGCQTLA
jgi:hypothetical protein